MDGAVNCAGCARFLALLQVGAQLGRVVQPEGAQSFALGSRPDVGVLGEEGAAVGFEHGQVLGDGFLRERLVGDEPLFPAFRIDDGRAAANSAGLTFEMNTVIIKQYCGFREDDFLRAGLHSQ